MTCITGVSGSGKSTLVHDCLYEALKVAITAASRAPGTGAIETGTKWISDVVLVDQSPIGRTPRSNPVTYIKAFDHIREVFAATREAQAHGYNSGQLFFQHSRRTLRNLPGRRHGHGRNAVPRRRRTDLRRLQGHALQERRARNPLQGKEHLPGSADDGAGSAAASSPTFRRSQRN